MILLSILIPVYNAEKFLARCLDSIVSQSLISENVEIVTINDGSKDTSLNILYEYAEKYHQLRVISRDNCGIGATRNELLEQTQGKYFWFVDADDFVSNNSLSTVLPLLKEDRYDMLLMSYFWGTENGGRIITYSGEYVSGFELTDHDVYNNSVWTRIYKTEVIKNNNVTFHNFQMGEDFDFIFNTLPHIGKIKCIEVPLYNYMVNPHSAITATSMEHKIKSSDDSLLCMEYNYRLLTHYSKEEQIILRKPLNHFLMGYLYSIIVVPFPFNYKKEALDRLRKIKAIPVNPLPTEAKKKCFGLIINNCATRMVFLWIDFLILKIKQFLH